MDSGPVPPSSKSIHSSKDVHHSPRKLVVSSIDTSSYVSSTSKSYKSPLPLHDKSKGTVPSKMSLILAAQQDNMNDALYEMNDKYKYQIAAWKIYYFITFIRLKKLKKLNIKLLNTNNYNTSLLEKCYKKTKLLSLTIQHQTEEMGRIKHAKEELQETVVSVREKYDTTINEMMTNYENVISEMTSNFDVKVEELSLLQSFQSKHKDDMQILVEVNSKIKYELDVNKDACKDLVLEVAQLKSEMELLNQRNNITLQHVQDMENIILKQNELVEQLTTSLSNQKNDSDVRAGKYEEHIALLDKRLSAAASNEEVLHNEIAQLKNEITELKSNLNQSKISNDRINNEKALVNNAMAVMVETMNDQKVKLDQHTKTIQKLKDEIKYLSKSKRKSSNMSSIRDKSKDILGDTDEDQEGNVEGANTTSEYHERENPDAAAGTEFTDDIDRVAWEIVNTPFSSNNIQKLDEILENNEVDEEKYNHISSEANKNSAEKSNADDGKSRRESTSDRNKSSSDSKGRRESSSDRNKSSSDNKGRRESSNTDRGRERNRKSTTSNSPDSSPHTRKSSNVTSSKSKTEEIILAPEME